VGGTRRDGFAARICVILSTSESNGAEVMGGELLERSGRPEPSLPTLASMASIIATRRRCRSAVQSVERKTSTICKARSSGRYPAPSVSMFASIAEPMPAPSTTMPRLARPEATSSAAARAKTG
jgi:hypothetical protein